MTAIVPEPFLLAFFQLRTEPLHCAQTRCNCYMEGRPMLQGKVETFETERASYHQMLAQYSTAGMKLFLGIYATFYQDGNPPKKTKELLGFVASLVLRRNGCILYHLIECRK
jgi:hypothetical protein